MKNATPVLWGLNFTCASRSNKQINSYEISLAKFVYDLDLYGYADGCPSCPWSGSCGHRSTNGCAFASTRTCSGGKTCPGNGSASTSTCGGSSAGTGSSG